MDYIFTTFIALLFYLRFFMISIAYAKMQNWSAKLHITRTSLSKQLYVKFTNYVYPILFKTEIFRKKEYFSRNVLHFSTYIY